MDGNPNLSKASKWKAKPTAMITVKTQRELPKKQYAVYNWRELCQKQKSGSSKPSASGDENDDEDDHLTLAEKEFLRRVSTKYVRCLCVYLTTNSL